MSEIGNDFRNIRLSSGISLEEASSDTEIPLAALEQIEEGSIGSFKDIFKLKEYLIVYAKYLGLDSNKVIDDFNEYMFEYTSKIPLNELEKAIQEKEDEENASDEEVAAVTPYLKPKEDYTKSKYVITSIVIIIVIAITLVWIIKLILIR